MKRLLVLSCLLLQGGNFLMSAGVPAKIILLDGQKVLVECDSSFGIDGLETNSLVFSSNRLYFTGKQMDPDLNGEEGFKYIPLNKKVVPFFQCSGGRCDVRIGASSLLFRSQAGSAEIQIPEEGGVAQVVTRIPEED